jgi:hypothetical protein
LTVVRNSPRRLSAPKAVAIAIGLCLAAGLAIEAPVHAASPSTAAARIVASRNHKKPGGDQRNHRTGKPHAKKHRTH